MDNSTATEPRNNRDGKFRKDKNARPPLTRDVQISKKLSWLLRHGAEAENLTLDSAGYASLADVLNNRKIKGLKPTFAEVREIVEGNDKQRFGMKLAAEGGDEGSTKAGDWLIRANQGHSIKMESEGLLQPITLEGGDDGVPETVVHGTSHGAWMMIVASGGLKPMGRNHIHFASGLPAKFAPIAKAAEDGAAAPPVISGMRVSSTILIFLDIKKALQAGIKFWRSDNGVILSEGDQGKEGLVGIEFFQRVEDRTGEGVLVEDGKVVKEAPASWATKGKGRR